MKVLAISPLDQDASVSLVEDGRVLFAAGEERFSRVKQHAGFPRRALEAALAATGTRLDEVEVVTYPFLRWDQEARLMGEGFAGEQRFYRRFRHSGLQRKLAAAEARVPVRTIEIPGLRHPNQRMAKGLLKSLLYRVTGGTPSISPLVTRYLDRVHAKRSRQSHQHWDRVLEEGLQEFGVLGKLKRFEHHFAHACNAYLASGFDEALIVTLDGYGSGLAGSVGLGQGGSFQRLQSVHFPSSLGSFYESVTSALGFKPSRHEGKIVGLAAYGDPGVLSEILGERFEESDGIYRLMDSTNVFFSRHLAARFPKIDVAAGYQHILEVVACNLVRHWLQRTECRNLVLSGGVMANVKLNQRLYELEGVDRVFIYPNMGDGGTGTGLALRLSWPGGVGESYQDVYFGPAFSNADIRAELQKAGLEYWNPGNMAAEVAQRIHEGHVIGRYDGRMEYGPRALGNRSILYHAKDPHVNQWLNKRLGRTEFMPFAPVTLWEARERCYQNIRGAEHAAEFMTITFDCTEFMKQTCPAAVHVDGTARPQLIRREVNPAYYDIVKEYERLEGVPSLINTSFNMHEEPIVCTPADAMRAFLEGKLDGLAIGPFFVPHPRSEKAQERQPRELSSV